MEFVRFLVLSVSGVLALGTLGFAAAKNNTGPTKGNAAAAATYKSKCQVCHGADGKGNTPAGKKVGTNDFHSPEVVKMSDADLVAIVKKGKAKMPGYDGKLTDDQIKALIKYIRSLK